ncbi:MAG: YggS family pyridoxal phosphate-dependent enzyme [Lachnospiraceae bacterium]|nr:YggS family pyridoxal phosphate-dependent enzyme [Lachnospiraceae bacterium]
MSCKENYLEVLDKVKKDLEKAGRDISECTLVAVSKTKPLELLKEAYDAGCRDFGENYVQELVDKIPNMPEDVRWHMIGHLQTNKVKYLIGKTYLIHSVDTVKLAKEIGKQSEKAGIVTDILLEVNVAEEESKFGFTADNIMDGVREIAKIPGVCIKGLMTSAPICEDSEENRVYFRKLKQLSIDIKKQNIDNVYMGFLSMGMSGDYEVALSEGSTYVRVGTAIFGERDYSKKN